MKLYYMIVIFVLSSLTAHAGDILPHRMTTQKGNIETVSEMDLTAIDNQALYLRPQKGQFDSEFYYKKRLVKGTPYLDIRISFEKGNYEFQVLHDKDWVSIGSVTAASDWQRVKLDLPADPTELAQKQKFLKVRIIGQNEPSTARLDYMGVSADSGVAQAQ